MRTMTIAVGSIMIAFAGVALAQSDYNHDRGHEYRANSDRDQECWNRTAGHFEQVRRGERQNDLDFAQCRYTRTASNSNKSECWNARAGHFEAVRPGERQDDLNFNNCRDVDERPRR